MRPLSPAWLNRFAARNEKSAPPPVVLALALLVLGAVTLAKAMAGPALWDGRRWLTLAAALGLLAASIVAFVSTFRRRAD